MRFGWALGILLAGTPALAETAVDVDVAEFLGCALYDTGDVYCFGQIPGDTFSLPLVARQVADLPPAESISVGRFGACAVDVQSQLWCWGLDYQRSMRSEEVIFTSTPFQVEGLPKVRAVDLGYGHVCAISREHEAWCWGENACGEIGCGHTDPVSDPAKVPYSEGVQAISAGVANTCATFSEGELVCWGSDNPTMPGMPFIYETREPLQLRPEFFGEISQVANGRNFACGIQRNGQVTCWGSNIMGQLGTATPREDLDYMGIGEVDGIAAATDLDADYFNACAVDAGQVICWGAPLFGPPDTEGALSAPPAPISGIEGATRVSLAPVFGCAVADGKVLCWGQEEHEGGPIIQGMTPTNPVPVPGLP